MGEVWSPRQHPLAEPGAAGSERRRVLRSGDVLSRVRSIVLALLTTEVAVLAVSGIALYFVYRPSHPQAWNDVPAGSAGAALSSWVRLAHRLAGFLLFPTAGAAAVAFSVRRARSRLLGPALGGSLLLTSLVALVTGFLLPWDQLALWAIVVGENLTGYEPIRGSQVRFVLIGGVEVAPAVVLRWLAAHAALALVMAVLTAIAWRHLADGRADVEGG